MLLEAQLIFAGNVLFGLFLNENTLYAEKSYSIKLTWPYFRACRHGQRNPSTCNLPPRSSYLRSRASSDRR